MDIPMSAFKTLLTNASDMHSKLTTDDEKISFLVAYFERMRKHVVKLQLQRDNFDDLDLLPTIVYERYARGYSIILRSTKDFWLADLSLALLIILSGEEALVEYSQFNSKEDLFTHNTSLQECYQRLKDELETL